MGSGASAQAPIDANTARGILGDDKWDEVQFSRIADPQTGKCEAEVWNRFVTQQADRVTRDEASTLCGDLFDAGWWESAAEDDGMLPRNRFLAMQRELGAPTAAGSEDEIHAVQVRSGMVIDAFAFLSRKSGNYRVVSDAGDVGERVTPRGHGGGGNVAPCFFLRDGEFITDVNATRASYYGHNSCWGFQFVTNLGRHSQFYGQRVGGSDAGAKSRSKIENFRASKGRAIIGIHRQSYGDCPAIVGIIEGPALSPDDCPPPPRPGVLDHYLWYDLSSEPDLDAAFDAAGVEACIALARADRRYFLDLSGRLRLTPPGELPASLFRATTLQVLLLRGVGLKVLPPAVRRLVGLRRLDVGQNALVALPPELGSLRELEVLELDFNKLTELPSQVAQLGRLDELLLDGNSLLRPPPPVVARGVSAIRQYFFDLDASGGNSIVSNVLKVVLCGQGEAGKTSVLRSLRDGGARPTAADERTIGVEITPLADVRPGLQMSFWDFAGQEECVDALRSSPPLCFLSSLNSFLDD